MTLDYAELSYLIQDKKQDILEDKDCPLTMGICNYYHIKQRYKTKKVLNKYENEVETFIMGEIRSKSNTGGPMTEHFISKMSRIIQNNCTDSANKSKQEMLIEIAAANAINVSGTGGGDFEFAGIKQQMM